MPETPHHALELHLSLNVDVVATWFNEIKAFCMRQCVWYAIKHELGENGKVHIHVAMIFEIVHNNTLSGGAKTIYNLKVSVKKHCPCLNRYLSDNPSAYALVVCSMKSDEFIAEYLQKEGSLKYFNLPSDLIELRPYFADLKAKKIRNPEYEGWAALYKDENRKLPATHETSWEFFSEHMYIESDMKIVSDPKRIKERVIAFTSFVNGSIPEMPKALRGDDWMPPHRQLPSKCHNCNETYYPKGEQTICYPCLTANA